MTTARRVADWATSGFGMGTGEPVWNSSQRSNSTRSDHNMRACNPVPTTKTVILPDDESAVGGVIDPGRESEHEAEENVTLQEATSTNPTTIDAAMMNGGAHKEAAAVLIGVSVLRHPARYHRRGSDPADLLSGLEIRGRHGIFEPRDRRWLRMLPRVFCWSIKPSECKGSWNGCMWQSHGRQARPRAGWRS